MSDRVANGLDTRAELKQADAAVPAARADLAATDEAIGLTRNRIAALLGKGRTAASAITLPVGPAETHGLPAGVTTDLIGRRPDIAAARARVEAAASRIKVARADFYPSINLSALIGFQAFGSTICSRADRPMARSARRSACRSFAAVRWPASTRARAPAMTKQSRPMI